MLSAHVDYELMQQVMLVAQTSATDGSTTVKTFQLQIKDVNEVPTVILL